MPTKRFARVSITLLLIASASALPAPVRAGFDTIIDSPPATFDDYGYLASNTQVNVYPGGVLPSDYDIGPPRQPVDNIEINLLGGSIGSENRFIGLDTRGRWAPKTNVALNLVDGQVWGSVQASAALVTQVRAQLDGSLILSEGSLATMSGGRILRDLAASGGSFVQIAGGEILGTLSVKSGSSVRISGGTVGNGSRSRWWEAAEVEGGSTFLMSGGVVNGRLRASGSYVSLTGGRVTGDLAIQGNSVLDYSGGSAGPFRVGGGGVATVIGGDFRLDGVPIEGLSSQAQSVTIPEGGVLTGVLSDGTPIAVTEIGYLQDYLKEDTLRLRLAPIPEIETWAFEAPGDAVPVGLRTGQTLTLGTGAAAPENFTALAGSNVSIAGGNVGLGFEAVGADVTLSAGFIDEQAILLNGATLKASGGEIGSNFEVGPGSRFELSGGEVGGVFLAHPASEVRYSGGKFEGSLQASAESSFTVVGGEFKINGVPVSPLAAGEAEQIDLPEHGVLSGTLSDGTPFAFDQRYHWFAPGVLTLQATELPAAGPTVIRVPTDPAPNGLRTGQTLLLSDGGEVGDHFTADTGSVVRMSGGKIGFGFKAVGSLVSITGGELVGIQALFGSVVNMDGGSVRYNVNIGRGAIFNLSGGELNYSLRVNDGGRANVNGGQVAGYVYVGEQSSLVVSGGEFNRDLTVYEGGSLLIQGGTTHGEIKSYGGAIGVSGGRLGDGLYLQEGGRLTLSGRDFRVDGVPIPVDQYGDLVDSNPELPAGAVLSGVLFDGTPFAFAATDGDVFSPGTLSLNTSPHWLVTPNTRRLPSEPRPLPGLMPGQALALAEGDDAGVNFTAGWESQLTITGGRIGDNFEAVGAAVELIEGSIGDDMDLFYGSELNVRGGSIGQGLEAHRGSVVNISGGTVPEIYTRSGSVLNITGGILGSDADDGYGDGRIYMEAGSELLITCSSFSLNFGPTRYLEPGEPIALDLMRDGHRFTGSIYLDAILQDGSLFSASISLRPSLTPAGWISNGPASIRLAKVSADILVPEPNGQLSGAMVLAASLAIRNRSR